ncbi:MAG: XRE family transcriptional regulator [Burkholderiaceae bacterium]
MDLAARLKQAMTVAHKNQSQLAAEIGVTTSAVSQLIGGQAKSLRGTTATRIEAATGVSAAWLVSGKGQMMAGTSNVHPAPIGARKIPLISYVQAGVWTPMADSLQSGDTNDFLLTDLDLSDNAFALEIKGESMLPDFKPGDRIIVDPQVQPYPGDFVVAKNGEDEATFKKYRPRGVSDLGVSIFELVPLNEDYPSMRSDQQPISIIGTMVEHRKYRRRF